MAPPERRPAVERQLGLLAELVRDSTATDADRRAAATADPSGLGSADDLLRPAPAGGDGPSR